MTTATEVRRKLGRCPLPAWARWLMIALLAAQVLFAHGCHGDEDHELFSSVVAREMP